MTKLMNLGKEDKNLCDGINEVYRITRTHEISTIDILNFV